MQKATKARIARTLRGITGYHGDLARASKLADDAYRADQRGAFELSTRIEKLRQEINTLADELAPEDDG